MVTWNIYNISLPYIYLLATDFEHKSMENFVMNILSVLTANYSILKNLP
jgi:hypothetical protein